MNRDEAFDEMCDRNRKVTHPNLGVLYLWYDHNKRRFIDSNGNYYEGNFDSDDKNDDRWEIYTDQPGIINNYSII